MIQILTDEESVEATDAQIEKVRRALISTGLSYPGTPIDALRQVIFMVNGPDWLAASDWSRAVVAAKKALAEELKNG